MQILIVGTAGRDFHVFNTIYRDDPAHRVVAFTSAASDGNQPGHYPACLAGPLYPEGIPIVPEAELSTLIPDAGIDQVVFAYSELTCVEMAGLAARALAAGADFHIANPRRSMLPTTTPVIAVSAARSGAGKSPTVRYLAELLSSWGLRVAVVRHPLRAQSYAVDREHAVARIDGAEVDACALPVREPFEGLAGVETVSGLDYAVIRQDVEARADVIVWDGAGTDLPFLRPSLHLLLIDPLHRSETAEFFPGEAALRLADTVLVTKCDSATPEQVAAVTATVRRVNPAATVLTADSPVIVEGAENVAGRTVVVVEDELTLSLGPLRAGAGLQAAHQVGVSGIISPLPQAVGSLVEVYARHPEAQSVLPALGYGPDDLADLKATLEATPSEAVIDATRIDLAARLGLTRPVARAAYAVRPHDPERLAELVRAAVGVALPEAI
jgi:predicted GTPase